MKLSEKEVLVMIGIAILDGKNDCRELMGGDGGTCDDTNLESVMSRTVGTLYLVEKILIAYIEHQNSRGEPTLATDSDESEDDEVCMFTDENGRML